DTSKAKLQARAPPARALKLTIGTLGLLSSINVSGDCRRHVVTSSSPCKQLQTQTSKRRGESQRARPGPTMTSLNVLRVTNLTRQVTAAHLREVFGHFGDVARVDLAVDATVGLSRG
ncbi:unnamed protein product, partial [Pelagomonas calceolata]